MGKVSNKQLVKLKPGRSLPKGGNLTNTTFKAKKIQIRGQKKEYVGQLSVEEGYKVLELLKSVHVNNRAVVLNALLKVSQFVASSGDSVVPEFDQIFNSLAELILNEDHKVRMQALTIMEDILAKFSSVGVRAHFPKLKSFISCALTHINIGIRRDSLRLLASSLKYLPDMCKFHSLVYDLLGLISQHSDKSMNHCGPSSSLTTISCGEQNIFVWRNCVLNCVLTFLRCNVASLKPENEKNLVQVPIWDLKGMFAFVHHPNDFSVSHNVGIGLREVDFNSSMSAFKNFIQTLIQILIQVWVEVTPSTSTSDVNLLKCAETMTVVLEIICTLTKWSNCVDKRGDLKDAICHMLNEKAQTKFFHKFPYLHISNDNSLILCLNDKLCQVYCNIILDQPHEQSLDKKVSQFLLQVIQQNLKAQEMANAVNLLQTLIKHEDVASLYKKHLDVLHSYIDNSTNQKVKDTIFNFFFNMPLVYPASCMLDDNHAFVRFLKLLPAEFILASKMKDLSPYTKFFENIQKLPDPCGANLQQVLGQHLVEITKCMTSENVLVRTTALSFIAKLNPILKEHFEAISLVIKTGKVSLQIVENLFITLTNRSNAVNPGFQLKDLSYFFMNLVFGQALLSLSSAENPFSHLESLVPFALSSFTLVGKPSSEHEGIANLVLRYLAHLPNQKSLYDFIRNYLDLFLTKSSTISIQAAILVLKFVEKFSKCSAFINVQDFLFLVADLHIACFLYALASKQSPVNDPDYDIYDDLDKYTYILRYMFLLMAQDSSKITHDTLKGVEHLTITILDVPIEKVEVQDYEAIAFFYSHLKNCFDDYISQEEWWCELYAKVSKFL